MYDKVQQYTVLYFLNSILNNLTVWCKPPSVVNMIRNTLLYLLYAPYWDFGGASLMYFMYMYAYVWFNVTFMVVQENLVSSFPLNPFINFQMKSDVVHVEY